VGNGLPYSTGNVAEIFKKTSITSGVDPREAGGWDTLWDKRTDYIFGVLGTQF
jgi:hypothetical protein